MVYSNSNEDNANLKWFDKDHTRQSLRRIRLVKGTMRGLNEFDLILDFPITAIAGSNGSGKSTLLAIAACAFHNTSKGYKLAGRQNSYYTFSDFFVQSKHEIPPQGIELYYYISSNTWRDRGPRIGSQKRWKTKGGKWNNYDKRVNRHVAYFGVQRVVPHFERSAHKSYRARFKPSNMDAAIKNKICEIAGKIIGKKYYDFDSQIHSKYSLPQVSANGVSYSGFNMGAGESAVFEILMTLFLIGDGALLVIDEIELGLHEKAQYRFIEELKKLCLELKCQIICSTHSFAILSSLPPEGRLFIEAGPDTTTITTGISADFACGKLGGKNTKELDVFVEDGISQSIVEKWLPSSIRKRVNIIKIGSHSAVIRQLSARYAERKHNCFCILDGDQKRNHNKSEKSFTDYSEASDDQAKREAKTWAEDRIKYLPTDQIPEIWLLKKITDIIASDTLVANKLVDDWDLENIDELKNAFGEAISAKRHSEFFTLAATASINEDMAISDVIRTVKKSCDPELQEIIGYFKKALQIT